MEESHAVVIESDRYRQEQLALLADPIITRMAGDVIAAEGGLEAAIKAASKTDFTLVALRGYTQALNGQNSWSIGGPAKAILTTLQQLKEAVDSDRDG